MARNLKAPRGVMLHVSSDGPRFGCLATPRSVAKQLVAVEGGRAGRLWQGATGEGVSGRREGDGWGRLDEDRAPAGKK